LSEGAEVQSRSDEGFARAGGRAEDDVFVLKQLQNRFFLSGVKLQFFLGNVIEESAQKLVASAVRGRRKEAQQRVSGHGKSTFPIHDRVSIKEWDKSGSFSRSMSVGLASSTS
jgi:hypothetical protein